MNVLQHLLRMLALLFVMPALIGCEGLSLLGKFQELQATGEAKAAPALAEVVDYRCTTMTEQARAHLLDAVNGVLAERGSRARAVPLDCDGDGAADF